MDELAAYFYEHVLLAYDCYRKVKNDGAIGNNKDRREAINAATALYHLHEHIRDSEPPEKKRARLAALCPDFGLLGDIVDASKHNVLRNPSRHVIRADSIYEVMVSTEYEDQQGKYLHEEKLVEVKLTNGSTRDIYEVLTNVINMWFDQLHHIGAIDQRQPYQLHKPDLVSREDARRVTLQMTQGVRWNQHFRFQQYNYESSKIEPVDLSGAKEITLTVHKRPTFEVELRDASGVLSTKEVELTPEQVKELKQIDDPIQRKQYQLEIAAKQGVMTQMVGEYLIAKAKEEQ